MWLSSISIDTRGGQKVLSLVQEKKVFTKTVQCDCVLVHKNSVTSHVIQANNYGQKELKMDKTEARAVIKYLQKKGYDIHK